MPRTEQSRLQMGGGWPSQASTKSQKVNAVIRLEKCISFRCGTEPERWKGRMQRPCSSIFCWCARVSESRTRTGSASTSEDGGGSCDGSRMWTAQKVLELAEGAFLRLGRQPALSRQISEIKKITNSRAKASTDRVIETEQQATAAAAASLSEFSSGSERPCSPTVGCILALLPSLPSTATVIFNSCPT